jgi:NAD(P)-dependent dehydrogenase (short-subunit alcohol dehydrogenase family)
VDSPNVAGQVAVITGAASGFGLALATSCAARGMRVALLDRDLDRVALEATTLADAHGVQVEGLAVDVGDGPSVDAVAATVEERFGRADLVVSNVGVQLFGPVERLTDAEWSWVLDINVVGSARVARGFLPLLRRSPKAGIAFTTSASVLSPGSRMAAYQASKFAVWGLAETLRLELADEPIDVTVIFPSGMASRHLESSTEAQPDNVRRAIGDESDFAALHASNPAMVADVVTPEVAARRVVDALLAGERYIVTHGDLTDAVTSRSAELLHAAQAAR